MYFLLANAILLVHLLRSDHESAAAALKQLIEDFDANVPPPTID